MQPIDLNPHDLETVLSILRQFVPEREVWAFGSRVKWTAKQFSDLDLAIIGDTPLPSVLLVDLKEAFDESSLPIKVDVVDWATTSETFRKIIADQKVVIQAAKPKTAGFRPGGGRGEAAGEEEMTGWREIPLGKFVSLQRGHDLTDAERRPGQVPVMGSAGQNGYHDTAIVKGPGIVIGRSGASFGKVHYCDQDFWPHNTALYVTDFHGNDTRFAYYLLQGIDLSGYNSGSAQPSLNRNYIYPIALRIPEPDEQRAIARSLGSLDDKIELNRRMNATLEAMARATFQSWFVDFDPVRAKAEGRMPSGMDAATAALFPGSLADSELGDIPSGWQATALATIVTERTARVGTGNGHAVLSAVSSGELKRSDEHFDKQVHSQDTSKYKAVEQWDYAYNPSRINIGSIGMLEQPALGAVSPVYTVVRPAEGYAWFLRFFLDLPQTQEIINQFCSGSVRQSLSFKDFASIPVVLPPVAVAQAFARYWMELDATRKQLNAESHQLAEIRDTLLPKLMSGELRVPETLMA